MFKEEVLIILASVSVEKTDDGDGSRWAIVNRPVTAVA